MNGEKHYNCTKEKLNIDDVTRACQLLMQEMLFLKEFDKKKNREGNFFQMDIDEFVNAQQTVVEVIVPVCRLMIFCEPSDLYESFYLSFLSHWRFS